MIGGGMHGFTGFGSYGWLGMFLGLVLNIALIVGVILLVVWLVKRINVSSEAGSNPGSRVGPKEILEARYARGEITREQYREILSDLGG